MKRIFIVIYISAIFVTYLRSIERNHQSFEIDSLEKYIIQYMDWYNLPGLAVGLVNDGEIVYTKGFGVKCVNGTEEVTKNTIFSIASVTKLFVGISVMQLYEENKMDLNDPISKYLPYFELSDSLYKNITITQLLNHTSGLPDDSGDEFYLSWKNPEYDDSALERYVKGLKIKNLESIPGEKYIYSNIGYEILGCMIAEVTGVSLEEYINKNILEAIDMPQSNMLLKNIDKNLLACPNILNKDLKYEQNEFFPYTRRHAASGTLLSNVEDMCHFAITILNRGKIDGRRILKDSSLKKMLTPENDNPAGLSFHVEKIDSITTLIFHAGGDPGFRTEFIIIPEKAIGVVMMTNSWEHQIQPLAYKALNCMMGNNEMDWYTFYHGSTWKIIRENNIEDAIDKIKIFVSKYEFDNFHPSILNQHGNLLQDLGRIMDAIKIKKLNTEFYPKNFKLYNIIAELYVSLSETKNALLYYKKSIEIKPENNIAIERLKILNIKN